MCDWGGSLYGELFSLRLATFPPLCATLPTALEGSTPRSRAQKKRGTAHAQSIFHPTRAAERMLMRRNPSFHRIFFFFVEQMTGVEQSVCEHFTGYLAAVFLLLFLIWLGEGGRGHLG